MQIHIIPSAFIAELKSFQQRAHELCFQFERRAVPASHDLQRDAMRHILGHKPKRNQKHWISAGTQRKILRAVRA